MYGDLYYISRTKGRGICSWSAIAILKFSSMCVWTRGVPGTIPENGLNYIFAYIDQTSVKNSIAVSIMDAKFLSTGGGAKST